MPLTVDDLVRARAVLLRTDKQVSTDGLWRVLKQDFGLPCARRTVRALAARLPPPDPAPDIAVSGESNIAPAPDPAPVAAVEPVDPVAQAQRKLFFAAHALGTVRKRLLYAKAVLREATQPVRVGERLYGSLHPHDAFPAEALANVEAAQRRYDKVLQSHAEAEAALARAQREGQQTRQEAWVAQYRPDLLRTMETCKRTYNEAEAAGTDRQRYLARLAYSQALQNYHQVRLTAPIDGNGLSPH